MVATAGHNAARNCFSVFQTLFVQYNQPTLCICGRKYDRVIKMDLGMSGEVYC